jgi:ribonuclease HI
MTNVTLYVDGAYLARLQRGAWAFLVLDAAQTNIVYKRAGVIHDCRGTNNVAGELQAATQAMQWCVHHQVKQAKLCYDYSGIEFWPTRVWQAKNPVVKEYVSYYDAIRPLLQVTFTKVDAHSHDFYNNYVDLMTKHALAGEV